MGVSVDAHRNAAAMATLDRLATESQAGKSFASGSPFGVAHAALFCCERWAPSLGLEIPAKVQAHFERVKARPAVQRALQAEGARA